MTPREYYRRKRRFQMWLQPRRRGESDPDAEVGESVPSHWRKETPRITAPEGDRFRHIDPRRSSRAVLPGKPAHPGIEGDGIARKSLGPSSTVVSTVGRASPASDELSSSSPRLRRPIEAAWRRQAGSGRGRRRVSPSISASSVADSGFAAKSPLLLPFLKG